MFVNSYETKQEGRIKGARICRRGPLITHLKFANNCILFGDATIEGAGVLKSILKEYEEASGQCINFEKLTAFSATTPPIMRRKRFHKC